MDTLTVIKVIAASVVGGAFASVMACVPGLHVYNVIGIVVLLLHGAGGAAQLSPELLVPFIAGVIVGYSLLNTVPSVLLAAPDESALFTVLPGQKYVMTGRGYEGTMLTALGGVVGLLAVILLFAPLAPRVLPLARSVLLPHAHWIVWCVICFMLMSEWPPARAFGVGRWAALFRGWRSLGAGLLTFLLSGLLGFLLFYRSPVSRDVGFLNLMPAFVGLFTVPWLLFNIVSRVEMPPQEVSFSWDGGRRPPKGGARFGVALSTGTLAGCLGGGFAAFFPAVTGGVGGFLAGHATALRDSRAFLISQGASKLVYYVGGFLLFFVPGVHLSRGGGAWMLRTLYTPRTYPDYYMALAAVALSGAVSFLLIGPLARGVLALAGRHGYRRVSCLALCVAFGVVACTTGRAGVIVMTVATGIGLLPVLFGSRRMNCLGVILVPLACKMSGVGGAVAGWLRLL